MVLFRQKLLYSGNICFIWAKVVVFEQKRFCSGNVVVFDQKLLYSVKGVVFGQKWLYSGIEVFSGRSSCIRASLLY